MTKTDSSHGAKLTLRKTTIKNLKVLAVESGIKVGFKPNTERGC